MVAQDQLVARNTELSNLGVDVSCDVDIDLWVNHGKETSEARTQRRSYLGGGAPQVRADSVRTTLDVASSGRSIDVRLVRTSTPTRFQSARLTLYLSMRLDLNPSSCR